jgi:hypothetical protein
MYGPDATMSIGVGSGALIAGVSHQGDASFYSARVPGEGIPSHFALTWDGKEAVFYVNGRRCETSSKDTLPVGRQSGLLMGAMRKPDGSLWRFHQGLLEDVRISKNVRYTADFTPGKKYKNDGQTIGLYSFDDGAGDDLKDSSGGNHDGKVTAAKWVRSDTLSAAPWKALPFDPEMTAWQGIAAAKWTVVSPGVVRGEGGTGWLGTRSSYENFEVELEYKLDADSNSGLFFRAMREGPINGSGFLEVQLLDDGAAAYKNLPANEKHGALFKLAAPSVVPAEQTSRWHCLYLLAGGDEVALEIDGTRVWKVDVVAANAPLSAQKRTKGLLGLQALAGGAEFRNVWVRPVSRYMPLEVAPAAEAPAAASPTSE